jgi:hypothetical protein
MTDRELIIDALRDYEQKARRIRENPSAKLRTENALRIRAELEDNSDYVVRGGA